MEIVIFSSIKYGLSRPYYGLEMVLNVKESLKVSTNSTIYRRFIVSASSPHGASELVTSASP